MFYDKELMTSETLGKVWRIGHGLNIESDEEKVSMANICDKLDRWVDNTQEDPHRRLSLRSSSILVKGAARLFKRKLEILLEDTQSLDKNMSKRKRIWSQTDTGNISQTFTDPELQETYTLRDSDLNITNETQLSRSNHLNNTSTEISCEASNGNHSNEFEEINIIQKVDIGIQTSPKKRANGRNNQNLPPNTSFDQNLPFGFVLIHENYNSRIPSKILFSSLNPDVQKLL